MKKEKKIAGEEKDDKNLFLIDHRQIWTELITKNLRKWILKTESKISRHANNLMVSKEYPEVEKEVKRVILERHLLKSRKPLIRHKCQTALLTLRSW